MHQQYTITSPHTYDTQLTHTHKQAHTNKHTQTNEHTQLTHLSIGIALGGMIHRHLGEVLEGSHDVVVECAQLVCMAVNLHRLAPRAEEAARCCNDTHTHMQNTDHMSTRYQTTLHKQPYKRHTNEQAHATTQRKKIQVRGLNKQISASKNGDSTRLFYAAACRAVLAWKLSDDKLLHKANTRVSHASSRQCSRT
jgi:hypothetical protein